VSDLSDVLAVAVILAAALGSIGYVGNSLAESRRGGGIVCLRWLRSAGVIIVWPLIVLWALV
jgi:hypothetical protein